MARVFPHSDGRCDRARQWSSLRADDELSEVEVVLLERHLESCAICRAFDVQLRSTTEALRTAPAEVPLRRFEVPARTREVRASRLLAVAAVVAAAALGSVVGSTLDRPAPDRPQPVQVSWLTDSNQLRDLPRNRRIAPSAPPREPGGPPEGII